MSAGGPDKIAFEVERKKDFAVVSIVGDLDMYTLPKAKEQVQKLINEKCVKVVFNLEKMNYIDSSGLGFFIGTLKRLKDQGGALRLVNLNSYISGIFNLINLHTILEVYDSLDQAIEGF